MGRYVLSCVESKSSNGTYNTPTIPLATYSSRAYLYFPISLSVGERLVQATKLSVFVDHQTNGAVSSLSVSYDENGNNGFGTQNLGGNFFSNWLSIENAIGAAPALVNNRIQIVCKNAGIAGAGQTYIYTQTSAHCPTLEIGTDPVTLFPINFSPSNETAVYKGIYERFSFETSYDTTNVFGPVTQSYAEFQYRSPGGTVRSVPIPGDRNYIDFDTSAVESMLSMEWRVVVTSNSNAQGTNSWISHTFKTISSRISNLQPTANSKVYVGFPVSLTWDLTHSLPSGAIGNITQTAAKVRWRPKGQSVFTEYSILGAQQAYTLPNATLPGGQIEWQVETTNSSGAVTTSEWVTFTRQEIPLSVTGLYPSAGSRVIKARQNRFGWSVNVEVQGLPGDVWQTSAILRWRTNSVGSVTQHNVGTNNFIDLPAGTFTANTVEWQVKVFTSVGKTIESEWVPLVTEDTLSTPACIAPVGQIIDDKNGVSFVWQHINATGTEQTAWQLSASTDAGAHYETLAQDTSAANSYTLSRGRLAQGMFLWRIQTRNSDGIWGAFSTPATTILRRSPETPIISYADGKPIPVLRWQSSDQEAYRVTIGLFDSGWIYGTQKEYQHNDVLADGSYLVTVCIKTLFELESQPARMTMVVRNEPGAEITATGAQRRCDAQVFWSSKGTYNCYYILRDGVAIAKTTQTRYIDCFACGKHTYIIRGMLPNGFYTDSTPIIVWSVVANAVISALEPVEWLELSVKKGGAPTHEAERSYQKSYVHYYGKQYPVEQSTDMITMQHTFSFTLRTRAEYAALHAMQRGTVVYKNCYGDLIVGSMGALHADYQDRIDLTFTIMETDFKERIAYDPISI